MHKKISILLFFTVLMLLMAACSDKKENTNSQGENNGDDKGGIEGISYVYDSSTSGEITFWTYDPLFADVIVEFNKVYPNIKVNFTPFEYGEHHSQLQTTLNAGSGAPDVAQVSAGEIPRYESEGLLEDLLQPPFDAGRYKEYQAEYNWERYMSLDGKRLLGIPWDVHPGVFFYRPDLYEQVGLPTDPEELGEFLQEPENVLEAAKLLAANDLYMYEWRDSPAVHYGDALGYFDSNLNYTRNNERMIEMIDIVKQGVQLGWAPQMGLFSDEGKQLIKQGKVASFPLGISGARHMENMLPDQAGKWRVTKMPLDLNVELGGSTFVIPAQGKNKEAAWAFAEWIATSEEAWKIYAEYAVQPGFTHIGQLPWYQEHTNDFLGGQEDFKLYTTIPENIPKRKMTILDGQAWPVFIDSINEAIDKNIDSRSVLQQIEDDTLKKLAPDIQKLKEEFGIE
ncbi:MAG TPA: extracellular solute-binding protein [Bacillaceae bacterium]|nr:extracellular solute-binding protein [Bacillaceae bacterium]